MGKDLVLVGGGHAHLTTITHIHRLVDRGHRVTLVGPSPYHYYSGMGPGMLGGFYRPGEIRFPVQKMAEERGGVFLKDRVSLIHPESRELICASGRSISYDVVSFNIGSRVPTHIVTQPIRNVLPVKPIENLLRGREKILALLGKKNPGIVTVGGGPAGVEISGNIAGLVKEKGKAKIMLLAGNRLLPRLPGKARDIAAASLTGRGVEVVEGTRTGNIEAGWIRLKDGGRIPYDVCFVAVGTRPPDLFVKSGLPTGGDGGLAVNSFLQSVRYPQIFGGGDCIHFLPGPLKKVGVYAVRQNSVLYRNLLAALEEKVLEPFRPGRSYFLILNLGDGRGLFWWGSLAFNGKAAFFVKNRIDRNFMRKF